MHPLLLFIHKKGTEFYPTPIYPNPTVPIIRQEEGSKLVQVKRDPFTFNGITYYHSQRLTMSRDEYEQYRTQVELVSGYDID